MRILFLTDNFPPETNAPAVRTFEHARTWVEEGHEVTVVTSVPNFPTGRIHRGYRNRPYAVESIAGIRVVRVWTFLAANAGTFRRSLDYLSYMASAIPAALVQERPDVVVGTSPQLLTVLAAWVVSRLRRVPCIFELRDLWPESLIAVGAASDGAATRLLARLSRFLYHRVDGIVAVTETFAGILSERGVPRDKISVVRNGVDLGRFAPLPLDGGLREDLGIEDGRFLLTYVGTIGMAHGLSTVLDAAQAARGEPILFLLVGEGAERRVLEREAARRGLENVRFLGAVPREEVPEILAGSDAVLVHLRDDALFSSVIPSKIFEAMATATPIILGVRGESAEIVARAECGITVNPECPEEILEAARRLREDASLARRLGENGRLAAEREFGRREAAVRMLAVLSRVAGVKGLPISRRGPEPEEAASPAEPSRAGEEVRERPSASARTL